MTNPHSIDRRAQDYETDVHAWALRQEEALRHGSLAALDLPHLSEEMSALGNSQYRALESALLRLLQHLLKWDYQPARRSRSWMLTIQGQRGDVLQILRHNPSLKNRQAELLQQAYRKGRNAMLLETRQSDRSVPDTTPYSWDDIMTRPIDWPEP